MRVFLVDMYSSVKPQPVRYVHTISSYVFASREAAQWWIDHAAEKGGYGCCVEYRIKQTEVFSEALCKEIWKAEA